MMLSQEERKQKAITYARPVRLNDDGTIYRAMWQLVTDRSDSVSSGNDQWIAPSRSTRLVALWVQVQSYKELSLSDEIQLVWDDAMEMPPGFDTTEQKR